MPVILHPTHQALGNADTGRVYYRRKTGQCIDRSARNRQDDIVGRKQLIGYVQILQYLLDHGRFPYLSRTHYDLNKSSWFFKSSFYGLIFSSLIHCSTNYSMECVFLLYAKKIIKIEQQKNYA